MSTLKGTTMHPDVDIQVHVETYLNDFSTSAQVKIQVEFNFEHLKKKKIGSHGVVLVKAFPLMYQLLM